MQKQQLPTGSILLSITRAGTFSVKIANDAPHCGVVKHRNTFKYEVCCSMKEETLDKNGFVIDNADIQTYFDRRYQKPLKLSCELLARQAAHDLYELFGKRKKGCMEITVRIWGRADSFIEYRWTRYSTPTTQT